MLLDQLTNVDFFVPTMSYSFSASSPAMVLPPQHPNQYFASVHYASANSNGGTSESFAGTSSASASIAPTPGSLAGRKRSRGDIHDPDDEDHLADGSRVTTPAENDRGKPIFGPGMTVMYPGDPGYSLVSGSQSGTWVEERTERNQFQLAHLKRPSISTRKSQRVDANASVPDNLAQLVLPPQMREVTAEPLIDEATRALGISWTRMDSSDALRISQAAYSKWIQNHYPGLQNVAVWFENSAIPGYLVMATNAYSGQQEYYIFSNDLTEARLVTSDPTQLLPRLQMLPALHLAAPGGCIHAETDPITAAQNQINTVTTESSLEAQHPEHHTCAAHTMELD